jgi:hypothetical protein
MNTGDLGLWRAARLNIDDGGNVLTSNIPNSPYAVHSSPTREDMISNTLIWILSKIVNFLVPVNSANHLLPPNGSIPSGGYLFPLEQWNDLEAALDNWHKGLPETFTPCARLPPVTDGTLPSDCPPSRTIFAEIWYNIPMCASAMQLYHMVKNTAFNQSSSRRRVVETG